MDGRLVLVGNQDTIHIGSHLAAGAKALGLDARFCDVRRAFAGPAWLSRINWHFAGHRPNRLRSFSEEVLRVCRRERPKWMLSTGLAPVDLPALTAIGKLGIKRLNYLTDDPWNASHKAEYFLKALRAYDHVFSARQSNIAELKGAGCRDVSYLPFGYNPELHFPQRPGGDEASKFECDAAFIGGADRDRVRCVYPLIRAGLKVALYGSYWGSFRRTRPFDRGHIGPEAMRKAISASKIVLCLVRRANRDGNSMRTFEIPASGGCMLVEDTAEHRQIFGSDGENALYFKNADEMVRKAKHLLADERERSRLARAAHELIINGAHTYKDRLITMLGV